MSINFDADYLDDGYLKNFFSEFVSLGESRRNEIYSITHAFYLCQEKLDLDLEDLKGIEDRKTALSVDKIVKIDKSIEPIKIRLNNRRFFCDCGSDEFYKNDVENVAICKACNTSYNL